MYIYTYIISDTSIGLKHNVIKRCLIKSEPVKLVAEEIEYIPP